MEFTLLAHGHICANFRHQVVGIYDDGALLTSQSARLAIAEEFSEEFEHFLYKLPFSRCLKIAFFNLPT